MTVKLPPLLRLIVEVVTLRQLLFNRFTVVLFVLAFASFGGGLYADANDDGRISGEVITDDGEAVTNATVHLKRVPLGGGVVKTESTTTDEQGEFLFTNRTDVLEFQIIVTKSGTRLTAERFHLYFYGQNRHVTVVVEEGAR